MRIDALNKVSELYKASNVKRTSKIPGNGYRDDMLEISQTGKDYHIAKQVVARTLDIREDRVNDIKKRIEEGTYEISAEDIADKIIEKYFDETV